MDTFTKAVHMTLQTETYDMKYNTQFMLYMCTLHILIHKNINKVHRGETAVVNSSFLISSG